MTKPKAKLAGFALIAALCAGFTLGLTAPAWGDEDELPPLLSGFFKMIQNVESFEKSFDRGGAASKRYDYTRPLADQGNANAQHDLGIMYQFGLGVPEDGARAARWYRKAAEQGMAKAQNHLGAMYHEGLGVLQDYAEAVKWYRKAAEQGRVAAQYNLGLMYSYGKGVPRDYAETHKWFNLAASRFPPGEARDQAVKNRDIVAKRMTPAQISEAHKLAREWMAAFEKRKK
jgi:hypothetical protein